MRRPLVHENQNQGKNSSHGCCKRIGRDYYQTQKLKSHDHWFDGFFNSMTMKLALELPSDSALASSSEVILRMASSLLLCEFVVDTKWQGSVLLKG